LQGVSDAGAPDGEGGFEFVTLVATWLVNTGHQELGQACGVFASQTARLARDLLLTGASAPEVALSVLNSDRGDAQRQCRLLCRIMEDKFALVPQELKDMDEWEVVGRGCAAGASTAAPTSTISVEPEVCSHKPANPRGT
jgi:hypothetical protein